MKKIADERIIVSSPSPENVFLGSPGLFLASNGRLFLTHDFWGSGVASLPGKKSQTGECPGGCQSKIYYSDNHGEEWIFAADLPVQHGRLFEAADGVLYLLGQGRDLRIFRSSDHGESWSDPFILDHDGLWMQGTCSHVVRDGMIHITMENRPDQPPRTWPGVDIILLSAALNDDLTRREAWHFSNRMNFSDIFSADDNFGVPFFPTGYQLSREHPDPRYCGDACFLESHVLEITDPNHIFYEPETLCLVGRVHTGRSNFGSILRARRGDDGNYVLDTFRTPAGRRIHMFALPGGHLKFHITYDPVSRFYFLVSSIALDSMTRPERLLATRYNLPDNERNRCGLYFSTNLFDWCFAGIIAGTDNDRHARSYPNMLIDGEDLLVVCRSGDARANSAHNTNLVTLHRIQDFRRYPAQFF